MINSRLSWLLLGACALWQAAFVAPAAHAKPAASGDGAKLDVSFFYDTLKDEGQWFNTVEYGDVWQPTTANKNDAWRPYTDGYWTYTDGGWMFVSNESFGWAVYHYGRWTHLKDLGWAWVPGTDWAPAWVTWRTSSPDGAAPDGAQVAATAEPADGQAPPLEPAPAVENSAPPAERPRPAAPATVVRDNYIGWAPLPPEPVAYGSYYSYGPTVDVDFGIEPYDYCFTDARYFGAPVIAAVLFDPFRSYECCERSVNVTNIYYNRTGPYRGFYNGGPDYSRLRGVSERPIAQYQLRRTDSAALAQRDIRAGQFNRVEGNTLNVAAPRFSSRNVNPKDGRVKFANRGAVPVTQASHAPAPAAVAGDARYQRAQAAFKQQGEAAHAQRPGAGRNGAAGGQGFIQGGGRNGTPAVAATPEARQARQQAGPGQGEAAAPASAPRTKAERRAARQAVAREGRAASGGSTASDSPRATRRQARSAGSGDGGQARESRRSARQETRHQSAPVREARVREQAPRVPRQAPSAPRGGGGGHGGGGHGEEKKKK